jgi:hypothetical protein
MKNAMQIISHLTSKPTFKSINTKKCIIKVISLLPPHLHRSVLFTYIKDKRLFIVLNHPGMKMEFHYKINLIKDLLKKVQNIDPLCKCIDIQDIKFFVSNRRSTQQKKSSMVNFNYKERSTGRFSIECQDIELKKLFIKIQECLKK